MWGPVAVTHPRANISIVTDYPFFHTANVTVVFSSAVFAVPIYLRIPSWSNQTRIQIGTQESTAAPGMMVEYHPLFPHSKPIALQ